MHSFYAFIARHFDVVWIYTFSYVCSADNFKLGVLTMLELHAFSHPHQLISLFLSRHVCVSHFYFHLYVMLAVVVVDVATKL